MSIIRERVYDAKTLLEGNRDTMCHQYARTASAPDATRPDMTDTSKACSSSRARTASSAPSLRSASLGTTGTVGWYGETRYGIRVGIDTDKGERVWTDANNVEVV